MKMTALAGLHAVETWLETDTVAHHVYRLLTGWRSEEIVYYNRTNSIFNDVKANGRPGVAHMQSSLDKF